MNTIQIIALILIIVGAVNWLLVGLFKFDLVALIGGGLKFGETNWFSRLIYVIVGLAGLYAITILF